MWLLAELDDDVGPFSWAYVWLGVAGLVLGLVALVFAYVVGRRHVGLVRRVVEHPWLGAVDDWLGGRWPRVWRFIRARFTPNQWHGLALSVAGLVIFFGLYVFALITEAWTDEEELYALDQRVYEWLIESMGGRTEAFMRGLTRLADGEVVAAVAVGVGVVLMVLRKYWTVVALALSVGVGAGVMHGLKWLFERARPIEQVAAEAGHSFPSGHTMSAVTLYGFFIYLVWRYLKRDMVRVPATVLLVLLILGVGLSRIVLRVHWVSDVAGGLAVGLAWLVFSLTVARGMQAYWSGSSLEEVAAGGPGVKGEQGEKGSVALTQD